MINYNPTTLSEAFKQREDAKTASVAAFEKNRYPHVSFLMDEIDSDRIWREMVLESVFLATEYTPTTDLFEAVTDS